MCPSEAIIVGMSFDVIEKQVVFAGKKVRLELHELQGEDGKRHTREICVHPGAVVILPIKDDDTVLLIRNYRYTVGETLLELPAGTLEPGEAPIDCAARELVEETGYRAGSIKPLLAFYASPGILTEKMHTFVATGLKLENTDLDEGEQIELAPMKFDDAIDAITEGKIIDSKTIATLLLYDRLHRAKRT